MERKIQGMGRLFLSMLEISTFTFGGGFVIISLMKKRFVDEYNLISEEEMMDIMAMAQAAPGAVAVNGAILVGRRIAGLPGVAAAVLGTLIPPMVILSLVSLAYQAFVGNEWVAAVLKGMQAGAAAVVADVAWSLGTRTVKQKEPFNLVIMVAAFVAVMLKVPVLTIILTTLALGIVRALWQWRKERKSC